MEKYIWEKNVMAQNIGALHTNYYIYEGDFIC